jgi:beta-galactosidase
VPETAEVVASFDDLYWRFPAITRNRYGDGTLVYEGTFLTDALQRAVIREELKRAGLTSPDQDLPESVKVRHGRNREGKLLHYYFNYSGRDQSIVYTYGNGPDLLAGNSVTRGQRLPLTPWNLAIIEEQ